MNRELVSYHKTTFALWHHHKWGKGDLDEMIVWEVDSYVSMLVEHLEDLAEKRKAAQQRG